MHEFDWLRAAFGEVERVYARGVRQPLQPYLDFPDAVFVDLGFASGCIGSLQACMTDFVRSYHGAVNGREGSLHFDLVAGTYRLGRPDGGLREAPFPGARGMTPTRQGACARGETSWRGCWTGSRPR